MSEDSPTTTPEAEMTTTGRVVERKSEIPFDVNNFAGNVYEALNSCVKKKKPTCGR